MKTKAIILSIAVAASLFTGCAKKAEPTATTPEKKADVTTTASITNKADVLAKAMGKEGNWLMAIVENMTVDKDLVMEGEYTKADKNDATKKVPAGRKLALYAQDDKKVKTASFTLKAPKLIVKSKDTKIQGGTFVGDVYVEATGFNLVDAKIDGNIYFASEDLKATYTKDAKSSVTGKEEVKKNN